jgi:hypothetical protein
MLTSEALGQDYDPDWASHLRVGALVGFNVKAELKLAGNVQLSAGKNGVFDDGYVIRDPAVTTGDFTTHWNYQNASQYDPSANLLTMHRTDSYSPDSSLGSSKNDGPFVGFDMVYGGNFWYCGRTRIGFDFGFGFLPISATDRRSFNATANHTFTTFDTTGPSIYDNSGNFPPPGINGRNGGYGTTSIHSTPVTSAADTPTDVTVTGSRTLDVTLFSFRLGPTFYWDINPYIGLSAGAGPALGFVTGEYQFDEMIGDAKSKGSFAVSDVTFGGYVEGTVMYHAVKNGDFYLSMRYMPLGTSTFSHGGREAKLDLQGAVYLSAGINWPF